MSGRFVSHLFLVWVFARRCIAYNMALSLLGGSALFAISLASADADALLQDVAVRSLRTAALMAAILIMTAGHALGLAAMRLFHGRELPYYRNAGLGEPVLSAGAWIVALIIGAALLLAGLTWI